MKNATPIFYLFLLQLTFISSVFAQNTAKEDSRDYLKMKDGSVVIGTITDMTDSTGLSLTTELGGNLFIPYHGIKRGFRKPPFQDLTNVAYSELGITYGLPGGINFVFGHWFKKAGFRLSGIYWNENFAAFQLHAGYKILDNNRHRHSAGFSIGRIGGNNYGDDGVGYAGLVYSYTGPPLKLAKKHHAWFAEIGYGRYFRSDWIENPSRGSNGPIIQLGYVYRFIPHAPRVEVIPIPKKPRPKIVKVKMKRAKRPKVIKKRVVVKHNLIKIVPDKKPAKCPENEPCPKCPPPLDSLQNRGVVVDSMAIYQAVMAKIAEEKVSKTYILIRDSGYPDGDVVSLKWNGELVLSKHELTRQAEKVYINWLPNQKNLLTVIAHNMGETFLNTSALTIVNEETGQQRSLNVEFKTVGEREIWIKGK